MSLLQHNQTTLEEVEKYTNNGLHCCIVNACGSGKTSVIAEFIKRHISDSFVILTKQKNAKKYYIDTNSIFSNDNIKILTYSKMQSDYKNNDLSEYNCKYLIVDEAHYIGAPQWKKAYLSIIDKYKPICIGVTATPQRFEQQGTNNSIVKDFFDDNVAGNYTSKDLQKLGVFVEPEYVLSIYNLTDLITDNILKINETDLSNTKKEYYIKKLNTILNSWEKESCPEVVLSKYLPNYLYKTKCNRILVYVDSISELPKKKNFIDNIICKIFSDKSVKSYDYTYQTNESELTDFLNEDDIDIKILYSIDKIMETIHIDDLNIMIMLRPSVSNRIITQQFGRINSINNKNKSLIIDMVDNLTNLKELSTCSHLITQSNDIEKITLNIPHISGYYSIFDEIDSIILNNNYYEYNGIRGTLTELCNIYLRNKDDVKQYIDLGYNITDAIELSPIQNINKVLYYNMKPLKCDNIKLTDAERVEAEHYTYLVQRIINKYKLDEDNAQEVYFKYLLVIHKLHNVNKEMYERNIYISATLRSYVYRLLQYKYILQLRNSYLEDELIDEPTYIPDFTQFIGQPEINKLLKQILTEREIQILSIRYELTTNSKTYEDIANEFGLHRERIRQIEARAMRKLRMSQVLKILRPYLNYYDLL